MNWFTLYNFLFVLYKSHEVITLMNGEVQGSGLSVQNLPEHLLGRGKGYNEFFLLKVPKRI